jgi:splicing suppressor protein 51
MFLQAMGKRKKHSTEIQQSTSNIQSVVKLQEKTSPPHVSACSEEATNNANTEATKNVRGTALLECTSLTTEVKFSKLTTTTKSQKKKDSLHIDSTESYHLRHRTEMHLSRASVVEHHPNEQNADKQNMNACQISAEREEKIIVIQTKSLPPFTPIREINHTSNKSGEDESAVKGLQHLAVQQNVTVASGHNETQRNMDLEIMCKNGLSPANVTPAATVSQTGVQEDSLVLLVKKQASESNIQKLAKTTGTTNDLSKMQNITENVEITEKFYDTKVPHFCAANNMTHFNTNNKHTMRELNKKSNISRCSASMSALPLKENESFYETPAEDTRKSADKENDTNEAPTAAPQLHPLKTVCPLSVTKKQSILQITGSEISDINEKSPSPVLSTAKVQTKSDLLQNAGINVDLTASTKKAEVSTNISLSSLTSSGCPVQKSISSHQEAKVELANEVPAFSSRTKTVPGSLSTEDSDINTRSESTQKSKRTSSHADKIEAVHNEGPALPLTTKALQGSTNILNTNLRSSALQSTYSCSRCPKKNSKCSLSLAVRVAKLRKEAPVHLSIGQCSACTNNYVRTNTPHSTKKLRNTITHKAKVSELSEEVSILPSTSSVEGERVPFASIKVEKQVLSVVQDKNTTASSEEKRHGSNDDQNPDIKLDVRKDCAVRNCSTNFTTKSRRKRMPISCAETLDSNEKQHKNKERSTSHICVNNQLPKSKECNVTIFESKAADIKKSPDTSNSIKKDTEGDKLKSIKGDRKSSNTILHSEEYYRRKRKSTRNKDTKIDTNPESSEKSKQKCSSQDNMQGLTNGQMSRKHSNSYNKNVNSHKSEENRQNSYTNLLPNAHNEEELNLPALEKQKEHERKREKETAQVGNKTDIQGEDYAESKTCDHKKDNIGSQMDPETEQGKVKQNQDSKSGESLKMMCKTEGPNKNKLNNSTQNDKKASAALSIGQLAHLTKTNVGLCPSLEDSEGSEMIFIPDSMHIQFASEPVSTVDEVELEYQLVQRHIFLYYVCHVCKSLESSKRSLKKCSNCKMISYCSKEHQREHWNVHKDLCKVVSKICKRDRMTNLFEKAVGISPDQYRCYRSHYINECTKELGRELHLWEKEMIYYPEVCHTCYESDRKKLTTCQKCHHVSYCQRSHLKPDHNIWCKEFQVYRDIILYQCYHGIIQPPVPDKVLKHYTPLTGEMKTFMLSKNTASGEALSLNRLNFVTLTDIATCPLTVLFCLQHCNFCLEEIRSLTIHLVGAEMQFEIDTLQKWELLLLHLVPSLRILKVVFVGPQLETESAYIQTMGKHKTCNDCNAKGRKVIYEFWKTLYHDYLKCDAYQKPDFISAFNAGLYRLSDFEGEDTWSPSIEAMFKEPDIPVAVTEYTDKELPFDIQRIQNIVDSLEIIRPPGINPFASLKPSLNFLSEETIPVIFKNFHITILKRRKI